MRISKNFTLEELTRTKTGLINVPGKVELENLKELVDNVLQPLRDIYGDVIDVNSGYRSTLVNSSMKPKGAKNSQHINGEAADIDSRDNARLFRIIKDSLPFDQLIWESGDLNQPAWVHVSYKKAGNRKQVLKMKNGKYYPFK